MADQTFCSSLPDAGGIRRFRGRELWQVAEILTGGLEGLVTDPPWLDCLCSWFEVLDAL